MTRFHTIEGDASYVFKALISALYLDYLVDGESHISFDEYLYNHLADLGEAAYQFIGGYFGDADTAVTDFGLGE